jgi:hypothetical protein
MHIRKVIMSTGSVNTEVVRRRKEYPETLLIFQPKPISFPIILRNSDKIRQWVKTRTSVFPRIRGGRVLKNKKWNFFPALTVTIATWEQQKTCSKLC